MHAAQTGKDVFRSKDGIIRPECRTLLIFQLLVTWVVKQVEKCACQSDVVLTAQAGHPNRHVQGGFKPLSIFFASLNTN